VEKIKTLTLKFGIFLVAKQLCNGPSEKIISMKNLFGLVERFLWNEKIPIAWSDVNLSIGKKMFMKSFKNMLRKILLANICFARLY
jgi:hypothetical protein